MDEFFEDPPWDNADWLYQHPTVRAVKPVKMPVTQADFDKLSPEGKRWLREVTPGKYKSFRRNSQIPIIEPDTVQKRGNPNANTICAQTPANSETKAEAPHEVQATNQRRKD